VGVKLRPLSRWRSSALRLVLASLDLSSSTVALARTWHRELAPLASVACRGCSTGYGDRDALSLRCFVRVVCRNRH